MSQSVRWYLQEKDNDLYSVTTTLTVWVELGRRMLYIPLSVTPDRWISAQSLKRSGSPLGTLGVSEEKKTTTTKKHTGIYLQMATLWVLHTNPNPICEFSLL